MKPITIIGGGLAGLTLGILLRRSNIPVTIFEAGKYPRHRVCGEFLSGQGRTILQSISQFDHAPTVDTATFHLPNRDPIRLRLREPALCISRYELDAALARQFQLAGGTLRANDRFTSDLSASTEGFIRATGRRRAEPSNGRLFGLKAHAVQQSFAPELQLHFGRNHYVGVCPLAPGRQNVCGLFFSSDPVKNLHQTWPQLLESATNLPNAWDHASFSTVAGLTLDHPDVPNGFAIGDAAAMIPPLTGNGMSMAFESAALALPNLERYARGSKTWHDACTDYFNHWQACFASRLRWAGLIQRLIFKPAAQRALFLSARACPAILNSLFARTR